MVLFVRAWEREDCLWGLSAWFLFSFFPLPSGRRPTAQPELIKLSSRAHFVKPFNHLFFFSAWQLTVGVAAFCSVSGWEMRGGREEEEGEKQVYNKPLFFRKGWIFFSERMRDAHIGTGATRVFFFIQNGVQGDYQKKVSNFAVFGVLFLVKSSVAPWGDLIFSLPTHHHHPHSACPLVNWKRLPFFHSSVKVMHDLRWTHAEWEREKNLSSSSFCVHGKTVCLSQGSLLLLFALFPSKYSVSFLECCQEALLLLFFPFLGKIVASFLAFIPRLLSRVTFIQQTRPQTVERVCCCISKKMHLQNGLWKCKKHFFPMALMALKKTWKTLRSMPRNTRTGSCRGGRREGEDQFLLEVNRKVFFWRRRVSKSGL